MPTRGRRANDIHPQNRPRCHAAMARHSGHRATAFAAPDQIHHPGHDLWDRPMQVYEPTEDRQRLQYWMSLILQDLWTLPWRSCSGAAAMDFQPTDDSCNYHRPPPSFSRLAPALVMRLLARSHVACVSKPRTKNKTKVSLHHQTRVANARIIHWPSLQLLHIRRRRGSELVTTRQNEMGSRGQKGG